MDPKYKAFIHRLLKFIELKFIARLIKCKAFISYICYNLKTKLGFLCKEFEEFEHSSKIDEYDEHEWKQCEFNLGKGI